LRCREDEAFCIILTMHYVTILMRTLLYYFHYTGKCKIYGEEEQHDKTFFFYGLFDPVKE